MLLTKSLGLLGLPVLQRTHDALPQRPRRRLMPSEVQVKTQAERTRQVMSMDKAAKTAQVDLFTPDFRLAGVDIFPL